MNIRHITNRTNDTIKYAVKIRKSSSARKERSLFFAEGKRLCADLALNYELHSIFCSAKFLEQNASYSLFENAKEIFLLADNVMEKICETSNPQGIACLFCLPRQKEFATDKNGILFCENLQDPANVGALIRSAAALGFGSVVLSEACADPYSQKALRASMGAIGHINLFYGNNFYSCLKQTADIGICVYAAALQNAQKLKDIEIKQPFALLIGNEGNGLSQKALGLATQKVYIEMQNSVESLNAGVAGALLMYHLKNFGGGGI